jgi:hypothetical protein
MPLLNDYYELTLATHWIPALVNLDYIGLAGNEENDLDAFMYDYWKLPDSTFAVHDFHPHFAIDEVSGLHADCYTCRLYFTNHALTPQQHALELN